MMYCKCLNDLEYQRAIRCTIGQEIALILWLDELDVDALQEEEEEQDILAINRAPTFPCHEVIPSWHTRRKSVWYHTRRLFEELLYL
jgi:hypothetical protein